MAIRPNGTKGGGVGRATLVSLGLAAGFAGGLILLPVARSATDADSQSAYQSLDRFGAAFAAVRANYPDEPDDRKMIEDALNGMISDLDPHSSYFDPKTFAEMQVKTSGTYGGVSGSVALGAGVGANLMIGGFDRSIQLQPLSVEGLRGAEVTAGLGSIDLKFVG